jgi:hypothetical protein
VENVGDDFDEVQNDLRLADEAVTATGVRGGSSVERS